MNTARWLILLFAAVLVAGFLYVGCEEDSEEDNGNGGGVQPVELLPPDGEISGWTKGTGVNDYQEAFDEGSLYDIIDGGAEVYIAHGFQSGVQQKYEGSVVSEDAVLYLFIADQGSMTNCEALFDENAIIPPAGTTVSDLGDEAIIDRTLPFNIVLIFRKNQIFVKVTIDKTGDPEASENIAMAFATNVESNIP